MLLWALCLASALPAAADTVTFKSTDSVALVADWHAPRRGQAVFVLLHGLGAGRGEWKNFSARAAAKGWGTLAVDMRGHGDSGGPRYTEFKGPQAWSLLERDAHAAVDWLVNVRHVAPERIVMAGASIGANLALRAACDSPRLRFALLLSPGWNYQGVTLPDAVAAYTHPIVFAAAPEDAYAFKSSVEASRLAKRPEGAFLHAGKGHGVGMLDGPANKAFVDELFAKLTELLTAGQRAP